MGQGPEERKPRRFGPVPVGDEHWEVCLAARCAGLPVCSFMGGRTEKPGREMSAAGIAMMVYMVGQGPGHLECWQSEMGGREYVLSRGESQKRRF